MDFAVCEQSDLSEFDEKQIRFESIKSRGKGGQNINKVETGIRATYMPTGETVVCMEDRTQLLNKHRAIEMLRAKLDEANALTAAKNKGYAWRRHTKLQRGEAVATFKGEEFLPIK